MSLLESIKTDGSVPNKDPAFPHAPSDWTRRRSLRQHGKKGWSSARTTGKQYAR